MSRRRLALLLLPLVLALLLVTQTGWAADDRVFYGVIALVVLSQIAWLTYIVRRQKQENIVRGLERLFPDD